MRIGALVPISPLNAHRGFLELVGPALEERGFESIWVPDHVVHFDHYDSAYPYTPDGNLPGSRDAARLEPLTVLGYLAALTGALRLGTGICLVAQRSPVYTAKQVADVDFLSGGRLEFGVGIGWAREEYDALNVPFAGRGSRTTEYLELMKTLWTDEISEYRGTTVRLPACRMDPKPVQRPHPPIHIGGESDSALHRVAAVGQGWYSYHRAPRDVPEGLRRLGRFLEERGRALKEITVSVCPPPGSTSKSSITQYRDAGVDRVVIRVPSRDRDELLRFLDAAVPEIITPAGCLP